MIIWFQLPKSGFGYVKVGFNYIASNKLLLDSVRNWFWLQKYFSLQDDLFHIP